jgi:hypothetical protein
MKSTYNHIIPKGRFSAIKLSLCELVSYLVATSDSADPALSRRLYNVLKREPMVRLFLFLERIHPAFGNFYSKGIYSYLGKLREKEREQKEKDGMRQMK